jgi:uncharacterized damage-inducible protein DinB
MSWKAPEVTRAAWPRVGGERAMLDGLVDWHRQTLLHKCAGLSAEQLKRCSVDPSGLSLLGLVRHMTNVERGWFWDFAGQMVLLHWTGDDPSTGWTDFGEVPGADPAADYAAFQETCQRSRELVADASLDDTFTEEHGHTFSLRFVYLHMIEEYARHNGHADLLRERIDGATGT